MVKVITEYEAFVYIWFDLLKKMYYIGYHKGSEYDNYAHSSTRMISFKMNNVPPQFKRRILFRGTMEECVLLEEKLLRNRFSSGNWDRYYNANIACSVIHDETTRAKISKSVKKQMKKQWKDLEFRAKISESRKKQWKDPEYRAKKSESMKKVYQDPEYRAKMSESMKKQWEDPEYRVKHNKSMKKVWQDPEYRAKQSENMKKFNQDPERRAKMSESMKKVWQDPVYRANMTESRKKVWEDPKHRAKQSENMTEKSPCEHCGKMVNKLLMARWHGDNCKHKKVKSYG